MPLMQRTVTSDSEVLTKPLPILMGGSSGSFTASNNGKTSPISCNSSSNNDSSSDMSSCEDNCQFYDQEMTTPMIQNEDDTNNKSPLLSNRKQRKRKMKRRLFFALVVVTVIGLVSSVLGLPFPDRRLPVLERLPDKPKRAYATLHSDSNPCYDMLLYVCVSTWKDTNSQYPLLLLHSVPLPPKVQQFIDAQQPPPLPFSAAATTTFQSNHHARPPQTLQLQQPNAGMVIPVSIPERRNYFVMKDRVRSAAAKFAVWDQTAFDQVAYHDSDTVFFENGDSIFDAPVDERGDLWLYAQPYMKYWKRDIKIFNSGNFLARPSKAVYRKILDLFQRRFWILSFQQFLKTADQGFLNAVFPFKAGWDFLEESKLNKRVKHVKFWLAMAGDKQYNITAEDKEQANQMADDMNLHEDLERCMHHQRYSE